MTDLKVALLQIAPSGTAAGNIEKGCEYCERAALSGADIALFPEMWSTGYSLPTMRAQLSKTAESADGDFARAFAKQAARTNMAIGVTLLERVGDSFFNSFYLFDRRGERVLRYAKVHTCDFGAERILDAGDSFPVAALDTARGKVNVGAMICYDREFPESARLLMLAGAELILVPNACPMEINRLSQLRARAYENMLGIATANYPRGVPDCNGHSSAFDGVAYRQNEHGSRDTLVIEAEEGQGIYIAAFPLQEMRDYRRREVHANAYRRPSLYGALCEEKIDEPFVRADRRTSV